MVGDELSQRVIGAALRVHRVLGPGLLESAYELCLAYELREDGLAFETQKALPIRYKGLRLDSAYRLDFVVEDELVVELKAVELLTGLHHAQLLSYLRLSDYRVGLLINFNVQSLRTGVKRVVHKWPE
jgi:GxxExxY protein